MADQYRLSMWITVNDEAALIAYAKRRTAAKGYTCDEDIDASDALCLILDPGLFPTDGDQFASIESSECEGTHCFNAEE